MADSQRIQLWECSVCGCLLEQENAPNFCPLCANENVFFIKQNDELCPNNSEVIQNKGGIK